MNVKRFFGRNTRDAMTKVRAELGADAVILKNRAVDGGIEILAMIDEPPELSRASLRAHGEATRLLRREMPPKTAPVPAQTAAAAKAPSRPQPRAESPELMSTVSFQEYVRERARQRQADEAPAIGPIAPEPAPVMAGESTGTPLAPEPRQPKQTQAPLPSPASPQDRADFAPRPLPAAAEMFGVPGAMATLERKMLGELRSIKGFLGNQLASLAWFDGIRRDPVASRLLKRMIGAGFSASLARETVRHIPADCDEEQADTWLQQALVRNLKCEPVGAGFVERGGVYALIGPTGVGKTTTAAKIAAQFALRHGAQSVGLITVDMYRIGAQDQLRTFGRLLGVPVHVAQDAQTLAEYVRFFATKKLVLIDTAGLGQRDERVGQVLAALSSPEIQRLVVLNAASQPETIEDVVHAYRAAQCAGVVLSKIDEAVKLGGALDAMLRHRLKLVGVANGQRVPEDWHAPDPTTLVKLAMSAHVGGAFRFDDGELAALFVRDGSTGAADHAGTEA